MADEQPKPIRGIAKENARELQAKGAATKRKNRERHEAWLKALKQVTEAPDGEFTDEDFNDHLIKITKGGKLLVTILVEGMTQQTLNTETVNACLKLLDRIKGRPAQSRKPIGSDGKGTTVLLQTYDKNTISNLDGSKVASVEESDPNSELN